MPLATMGKGDPRRAILIPMMACMALIALDSTVISTVVPSIVRNLGGFNLFPWLFSVYLLTQAVSAPIYGRLADLFGRKRVMFFGIITFLAGSVLCGLSWDMGALIAFRALQGIGAGAVQPLVVTILGDIYTVKERSRVQGYTASVWGGASVLGPLMGGAFAEFASWRWIFYINVPVGIVAMYFLHRRYHETVEVKKHQIDYLGALFLTGGLVLVIFGFLQIGAGWSWGSRAEQLVMAGGVLCLIIFGIVESHVPEPIVPKWLWSRRPLVGGNLANFAIGATSVGLASYIPIYVQGVRGKGAIVAGLTVATVTFGWPLAAAFAGRLYLRFGFRFTAVFGAMGTVVGAVLYGLIDPHTSLFEISAFGIVLGIGLGFCANPIIVGLQSVVGWSRRGVVTASTIFSRSLGSAVGVAILGSIANASLARWMLHPPKSVSGQLPHTVEAATKVLGQANSGLSASASSYVRLGLYHGIHDVLLAIIVVTVAMVLATLCLPKKFSALRFGDESDGESDDVAVDSNTELAAN